MKSYTDISWIATLLTFHFPGAIVPEFHAVAQRCSGKKVFLEILQNPQENTSVKLFSCEFCKISKNTFFHRTPPVAASDHLLK